MAIVVVMIVVASAANAGWVLTDSEGEETLISQGKLRSSSEGGSMILDATKNQAYFIDDARKLVASGTVEEFCTGMTEMMSAMLEKLPPEQRQVMEQMMESTADVEIVNKGAGGKIAGFETTKYEVMVDGQLHEQLWLSEDKALLKDCGAVMKMMAQFMSCMSTMSAMSGAPSPEASPEYGKLFEMGMLVKMVTHGDGGVTTIAPRDVSGDMFAIPADYKLVSLPEMYGMSAQ